MSTRPIFVATHPRACSTAFERVFMTRRDILNCAHEPFGDAFYSGPERLSERYEQDEDARVKSGFSETTYKTVMDRLGEDANEGKRVFVKDMAYYLFPPDGKQATLAPSLGGAKHGIPNGDGQANGVVDNSNPSVVPSELLRKFHFTFLIRHPRRAIPSYFRCTVPPLSDVTGFHNFMPSEAGYRELRLLFDFLKSRQIVGPGKAGETNGADSKVNITIIDADDLLDHPAEIIEAYCKEVDIDFNPDMLRWEDAENQQYAEKTFAKWTGFHEDVLKSTYLKPRSHSHKTVTVESENAEWREKYGEEGQKIIRESVDANIPHYDYLKSFAMTT